jgi:uncharacterized membrane protein
MYVFSLISNLLAVVLAVIAGVGSPVLGSVVFCVSVLLLRALGRYDLVSRVMLPIFACIKLLAFTMGHFVAGEPP